MDKVVDKRKTTSGREILRPVTNAGIPGEEGGLIKRTRCGFESKASIAVRGPYVSTLEFGREDDDYGGKRPWRRFGAKMDGSGGMGYCESDLLFGGEETVIPLLDR